MEAFLQRRFKNFRAMSRWLGTGHVKHGPTNITFCGEFADVRTGVFGNAWFVGALCSLSMSEDELFGRPSGYEEPLGVYPRVFLGLRIPTERLVLLQVLQAGPMEICRS